MRICLSTGGGHEVEQGVKRLLGNWLAHGVSYLLVLAGLAFGGLPMFAGGLLGMAAGIQAFASYSAFGKFIALDEDQHAERRRLSIIIMVALALKAITIVMGFRLQADWGNPAIVGLATGLLWVYFSAVGWLMAT